MVPRAYSEPSLLPCHCCRVCTSHFNRTESDTAFRTVKSANPAILQCMSGHCLSHAETPSCSFLPQLHSTEPRLLINRTYLVQSKCTEFYPKEALVDPITVCGIPCSAAIFRGVRSLPVLHMRLRTDLTPGRRLREARFLLTHTHLHFSLLLGVCDGSRTS